MYLHKLSIHVRMYHIASIESFLHHSCIGCELKLCSIEIQNRSANKSSEGENPCPEQCSKNSFSISNNSSHIPHPKHLEKETFVSTEDLNLVMFGHSPSVVFSRGPAISTESRELFFEKHSSCLSITPVLRTVIKRPEML